MEQESKVDGVRESMGDCSKRVDERAWDMES
jgi:hypothetical protein